MYAKEKRRRDYPEKRTTDRNPLIPAKRYPGRVEAEYDIRVRRTNIAQKNVVQREVKRYKPEAEPATEAEQEFDKKTSKIDGILQTAYNEFCAENFGGASRAYRDNYIRIKSNYDEGKKKINPSAAAGYVIESKVNAKLACMEHVRTQVTGLIKGSRPDIVLDMNSSHASRKPGQAAPPVETVFAALDITAEQSWGHIFKKKGNWCNHKHIIYVAELTYPSIDFRTMGPITLTKEEKDRINSRLALEQEEEELERRVCQESFLSFQEELVDVMEGGYPCGKMNDRQMGTLSYSFGALGLNLNLVAGSLTVTKIIGFEKAHKLNWAIIGTLKDLKDTLVFHILQKELIGIDVGINLDRLHDRLGNPLAYQVPFSVDG